MIDGLKVQMSTEELAGRLAERIEAHQKAVREYEREEGLPETERRDPRMPEYIVEHELQEEREQVAVLILLRDHLIPGETYLLSEQDLRFADLAPDFHMTYLPQCRSAADVGATS